MHNNNYIYKTTNTLYKFKVHIVCGADRLTASSTVELEMLYFRRGVIVLFVVIQLVSLLTSSQLSSPMAEL